MIRIRPPSGVNLIALLSRLTVIWTELRGIGDDRGEAGLHVYGHRVVLALRERFHERPDLVQRLGHLELREGELHPAGFDLREVEDVVDDLQQQPPRSQDVLHVAVLLLVQGPEGLVLEHFREPDDRVQRRAKLVTHLRQELRLGPAGCLGRRPRAAQLVFRSHALGDVEPGAENLHRRPGGIAQHPGFVPHPVVGAVAKEKPVLAGEPLLDEQRRCFRQQSLALLGVEPCGDPGGVEGVRRVIARHAREVVAHEGGDQLSGPDVDGVDNGAREGEHLLQPGFGGPERIGGLALLGDVVGDAEQELRPPIGIEHRDLLGMQDARAFVARVNDFFRDVEDGAARQHLAVFRDEKARFVPGEEVKIALADQLLACVSEQLLTRPVDAHEPQVGGVLDEHHVRDLLDHRIEERAGALQLGLCAVAGGEVAGELPARQQQQHGCEEHPGEDLHPGSHAGDAPDRHAAEDDQRAEGGAQSQIRDAPQRCRHAIRCRRPRSSCRGGGSTVLGRFCDIQVRERDSATGRRSPTNFDSSDIVEYWQLPNRWRDGGHDHCSCSHPRRG